MMSNIRIHHVVYTLALVVVVVVLKKKQLHDQTNLKTLSVKNTMTVISSLASKKGLKTVYQVPMHSKRAYCSS